MNKKLITLFVVFAMFFAACGTGTDGRTSGFGGGDNSNSGGSSDSGIEVTFSDLQFVPQKGNEFSLYMNIKNHQRHEISDLEIRPTGFDWGYIQGGLQQSYGITMGPATDSGPSQNAQVLEGVRLDGFTGDYSWNPVFKYCYTSTSTFREQVEVPNSLGQVDGNNAGGKFSNGPLEVSIVQIYPKGDTEIGVDFEIRNGLRGFVVNECFQDENKNQFGNIFTLNDVKLGSASGNCEPTSAQDYMINDDRAKFRCLFPRNSEDPYTSQITVDLEYKYQQQVKKDVTIRDLDNR